MMKTTILPVGKIDSDILDRLAENMRMVFTEAEIAISSVVLPVPEGAFSKTRQQYRSDTILDAVRVSIVRGENNRFSRMLGVADVDLFVPRLNFVFGQAECPGNAALISLFRLKPEFYRRPSNVQLTIDRGTKEAMHEIGHTLGLKHCVNPFCVMYFSNSIFETDRKQSLFCNKCYQKTQAITAESGKKLE